jgi:hypothetical protein
MANTKSGTIVLGSDQLGARRRQPNALFARTPLELIQLAENDDVGRVLLAGEYVGRHDIVDFIHDEYPALSVCFEHLERPRPMAIIWQLAYA